jgi:hypothetical protein
MPNKRPTYLLASSIIAGLATFLFAQRSLLAQSLPPGTDLGYNSLPQALVDVNGDGLIDYCRFVGDAPTIYIACMLGTPSGFDINNQLTAFVSARGISQGYSNLPRGFRDVNSDGKADFCRFDGPPGKVQEYCNPAFSKGFGDDSQRILTGNTDPKSVLPPGTDLGYNYLPQAFVDVNGDGRLDYCRFVGDVPTIYIACMLGKSNGFDVTNQLTAFISARGINQGYPDRPRGFRDVNGDGKADYCRFDGPPGKIQEYCNPAFSTGFGDDSQRILTGNIDPVIASTSSLISPETSGTVNGPNKEVSMGGGYAEAEATFYRNGLVVISTHSKSKSWSQGTKGSVFVVGSDTKGRNLFVSPVFDIPTACSRADSCSSDRRDNVQYQVNSEVAKYITKVDIYVQDRSGGRSVREAINNTIKESCATYNDLPASAKAGIASQTGFAGCGN